MYGPGGSTVLPGTETVTESPVRLMIGRTTER
jgi:hypothetical protein